MSTTNDENTPSETTEGAHLLLDDVGLITMEEGQHIRLLLSARDAWLEVGKQRCSIPTDESLAVILAVPEPAMLIQVVVEDSNQLVMFQDDQRLTMISESQSPGGSATFEYVLSRESGFHWHVFVCDPNSIKEGLGVPGIMFVWWLDDGPPIGEIPTTPIKILKPRDPILPPSTGLAIAALPPLPDPDPIPAEPAP